MKKLGLILIVSVLFSFLFFTFMQAQDTPTTNQTTATDEELSKDVAPTETAPVQEEKIQPQTQWIWAEVVSVDAANKTLVVKYLDYETDKEEELTLNINEKTVFENVKSIDEIKQNDALSIDYIITDDGKNIAKKVSLDKLESPGGINEEAMEKELMPAQEGILPETESAPAKE